MSLKEAQCLPQLLHGTLPFHGHGQWLLMHFRLQCARSLYLVCTMSRYWVFVFYTILFMHSLMKQVSAIVVKLRKEVPKTYILSNNHIPSKTYWDLAVNRALQLIDTGNSALIKVLNNLSAELLFSISFWGFHFLYLWTSILSCKIQVVLARSSRVVTTTDIDPIAWLACLQVLFFFFWGGGCV